MKRFIMLGSLLMIVGVIASACVPQTTPKGDDTNRERVEQNSNENDDEATEIESESNVNVSTTNTNANSTVNSNSNANVNTNASGSGNTGITMATIATHATAASCWSAINGNVYDLTKWIPQHPGGEQAIKMLCGKDGTAAFNGQHGGQQTQAKVLAQYKIGALAGAVVSGSGSGATNVNTNSSKGEAENENEVEDD